MYKLVRKILFLFDAEEIHELSTKLIKLFNFKPFSSFLLRKHYLISDKSLERELFGIKFKNPIGLAAGFDKNATLFNDFRNFGFGFIEIGTVTPLPQDGNPKKRIFRLSKDEALINRLGFNNSGVEKKDDENNKRISNENFTDKYQESLSEKNTNDIEDEEDDIKDEKENEEKRGKIKMVIIYFIVVIISLLGLIFLLDTFKSYLLSVFPSINPLIDSFYQTLLDFKLFIKDLSN